MKAVFTTYLTLLLLSAAAFAQPPSPAAPPFPATLSGSPVHLICFYTEDKAAGKAGFVYAIPGDAPTNAYSILYPTIGNLKGALMRHGINAIDLETNLNFSPSASSIQRPLNAREMAILLRTVSVPPPPPPLPNFNKPHANPSGSKP